MLSPVRLFAPCLPFNRIFLTGGGKHWGHAVIKYGRMMAIDSFPEPVLRESGLIGYSAAKSRTCYHSSDVKSPGSEAVQRRLSQPEVK